MCENNIYIVHSVLNKRPILLPCCNGCEYSEHDGPLSDGTCYCNFWNAVVEIDGFCYKGRNSQLNRRQ